MKGLYAASPLCVHLACYYLFVQTVWSHPVTAAIIAAARLTVGLPWSI